MSVKQTVRDGARLFVLFFVLQNSQCSTFFDLVEQAKSLILKENSGFVLMFYVFSKRGSGFLKKCAEARFCGKCSQKQKNTKIRPYPLKKRRTLEQHLFFYYLKIIFINKINDLATSPPHQFRFFSYHK